MSVEIRDPDRYLRLINVTVGRRTGRLPAARKYQGHFTEKSLGGLDSI